MSTSTQLKAVFLVVCSATLAWGQRCDPSQVQNCMQKYATSITDSWPSTKEELEKKCTVFSNIVDCTKSSLKNCNEDTKRLFEGIENFKAEVCDINSPMAKGYMQHSKCLRNAHADVFSCAQRKVRSVANPCSLVRYIAQCSDEAYEAKCGPDANKLAKNSYGISLQAMCPQEVKEYLSSDMGSTDATQLMGTKPSVIIPYSGANSLKYSVIPAFLLPGAILLMRFLRDEM